MKFSHQEAVDKTIFDGERQRQTKFIAEKRQKLIVGCFVTRFCLLRVSSTCFTGFSLYLEEHDKRLSLNVLIHSIF